MKRTRAGNLIVRELREHAPFTFWGAVSGIVFMLFFRAHRCISGINAIVIKKNAVFYGCLS